MKKFYKEHLEYIQNFWNTILIKGDVVVDATIGNGYDSLYLSRLILQDDKGALFGYDMQSKAIESSKIRLMENLPKAHLARIKLFNKSHEYFNDIKEENIKLITYNLGYLPGSDKTILTNAVTTTKSIKNALQLNPSYISIVCYSGHQIGKIEEHEIFQLLKNLSKKEWVISRKQWINRELFPSVFLLKNLIKQ